MKKVILFFSVAVIAFACAPELTTVETTPPTVVTETTPDEIMSADAVAGKGIYFTSCVKCHKAKIIDDYTLEQWTGILPNMIGKAKLDETKGNQVTQYVYWELEH